MNQIVLLIGNLGDDPELRYVGEGVPLATFQLAVNRWTPPDSQEERPPLWFRISTWRKIALAVAENLKKGRSVLVVGEIDEPFAYTTHDNEARATMQVTARSVRFLGKPDGTAPSADEINQALSDVPF